MSERTGIEWTDATYNPWVGCEKVSPGCAHCYMFGDLARYGQDPTVIRRTKRATFEAPLRATEWKQLAPGSLVFTCSWSDFFHPAADAWRPDAWEVIRKRPDLRWQVLTKRPELIADRLPAGWPWPHVWLGVSIENRRFVDRADVLRGVPAAVRFVSAEPLLGPLVRRRLDERRAPWPDDYRGPELDLADIDWLIIGGESGPRSRPMDLQWARDLTTVAREARTAVFVKQLGSVWSRHRRADGSPWSRADGADRRGAHVARWPRDLRVRELPA